MSVYVDDMRAPYGRMIMCHMVADTLGELHIMAVRIGVSKRHFQNKPNRPHYDIALSKRALAVKFGAKEVTQYDTLAILKRNYEPVTLPPGGKESL